MATALTGTNRYSLKSEQKKRVTSFTAIHGELALETFDAEVASYAQILGAVESLPFLATKKMVVVNDLSANSQAASALEQLIDRAGDSTDLLIVESKLDKRGVYYKQLKKHTDFHEYNELEEGQLASWLVTEAKDLRATVSRSDAAYLVQRVGINQLRLSNDLKKLVQYNATVNRASIDALTDENPSSTIFNLVDSIFAGNVTTALKIYEDQRKQKIEPQAIHGMLTWQMHAVAVCVSAPKGTSSAAIAKDSGMSPYTIQKSQRIARNMGRANVIAFMKLLRDIDYKGKHQIFDYDEALRFAIMSLSES